MGRIGYGVGLCLSHRDVYLCGDGVITTGGESIYARADSDIAKAAKMIPVLLGVRKP